MAPPRRVAWRDVDLGFKCTVQVILNPNPRTSGVGVSGSPAQHAIRILSLAAPRTFFGSNLEVPSLQLT